MHVYKITGLDMRSWVAPSPAHEVRYAIGKKTLPPKLPYLRGVERDDGISPLFACDSVAAVFKMLPSCMARRESRVFIAEAAIAPIDSMQKDFRRSMLCENFGLLDGIVLCSYIILRRELIWCGGYTALAE